MVKAFGLTVDYVLNEMSYQNVIMYSAVLPSYSPSSKKENGRKHIRQEVIKADDPRNRDRVRQMVASFD